MVYSAGIMAVAQDNQPSVGSEKKNDFSALTPDPPFNFFPQLIKFALTKHDHSKAGRLFKAFVFLNASNSGRQTLYLYYQMIKFAFPCI